MAANAGTSNVLRDFAKELLCETPVFKETLAREMREGHTYPQARNTALEASAPHLTAHTTILTSPNNILGIEYCKAILKERAQIDPLPAGIKSSTKPIKDATLIDPARASAVARRLLSYYQMRYTDEGQLLPGDEKIGQVIELQSIGGKSLTGPIQRLTVDLTGGYLIKATMRGA